MSGVSDERTAWVSLAEMADGFDEYVQAPTRALDGAMLAIGLDRTFTATLGDTADASGGALDIAFGATELTLTGLEFGGTTAGYEAFEISPALYYVHATVREQLVVSFAYDAEAGTVVGAIGELGLEPEPFKARQRWFRGAVAGSTASLPAATGETVGLRLRHRYSSDDVYDHIYLTPTKYTWLCSSGAEAGQADTDPCVTYKLRDGVYLFSWLERVLGVEGMVVIDHERLRSIGIQFCVDQYSGETINLLMGAHSSVVSTSPSLSELDPEVRQ